jgi:DNA-binding winged helix-turn-helix (wHTH) protein
MSQLSTVGSRVRIGEFEIDLDSGEFVDNGARVRLQVQSLALLKALLERPGSIVGREELRQRLWPSDTFVDFDHGLNAAVRRLREAFGDSAETPRFVETIPRKGYRLVAPTEPVAAAVAPVPQAAPEPVQSTLSPTARRLLSRRSPRWAYMSAGMLVLSSVAAGAWLARTPTPVHGRPSPVAFALDVPAGWTLGAFDQLALSPDGRYLVFTAAGPDGRRSLWLRPLAGQPRQIPGSDGAMSAFWSPDSASIAFFADGALKAVPLATGTAQVLTRVAPAR